MTKNKKHFDEKLSSYREALNCNSRKVLIQPSCFLGDNKEETVLWSSSKIKAKNKQTSTKYTGMKKSLGSKILRNKEAFKCEFQRGHLKPKGLICIELG